MFDPVAAYEPRGIYSKILVITFSHIKCLKTIRIASEALAAGSKKKSISKQTFNHLHKAVRDIQQALLDDIRQKIAALKTNGQSEVDSISFGGLYGDLIAEEAVIKKRISANLKENWIKSLSYIQTNLENRL
jgi:hypothetical protein